MSAPPRSSFVNVVAALICIFDAFGIVSAGMSLRAGALSLRSDIFQWFLLGAVCFLGYLAFDLWTCVALMQRKHWSRKFFIGLRIANLATMALGVVAFAVMAFVWSVGLGELMIQGVIVAIWIPCAMLLLKTIRVLRSPEVVAEFD